MSFAAPILLWLLVPLAALALLRSWWRSPTPRLAASELDTIERAARPTWRTRTRWLPVALRWAAITLLVVAIARPREGVAVALIPQQGIDVVAVVDVSSSMNTNLQRGGPSRLQAAKFVLSDFVNTLEGDRVGLVMFRSSALTLSPLTHDYTAVQRRITSLATGLLPDGTAIGLGIAEGVELLRESPARSRVIVLLTDGQNNRGAISPVRAAQLAETLGVRLYSIGFTGGADQFGTRIDGTALRRISEGTGGRYFDAQTAEDLAAAYQAIGELERSQVGEREFTSFNEFAPWLVGFALALLTLEVAGRAFVWRRYP